MDQDSDVLDTLREVEALRGDVAAQAREILRRWEGWITRDDYAPSAENFAHYLAFRRHEIRPLQRRLMAEGLSSLGRAEGRVLPTLDAVVRALQALAGNPPSGMRSDPDFFVGEERIAARTVELLGQPSLHGPVPLMVTLPSEAADNPGFLRQLAELGVEAVRINCAHDEEEDWAQMIAHVVQAGEHTGRRMKVFMDLAGPKIRTGAIRKSKGLKRVILGEQLALALPGQLGQADPDLPAIECTLPEALLATDTGHRLFVDDGKLQARVVRREPWGVLAEITAGPEGKGYKLKPEKGINFPDTEFSVPALTGDDVEALRFIAHHADGVEFSFVQEPEDVVRLQEALAGERPDDWHRLGLVLKIETARAVRNLPDLVVRAAGGQPTAIMIARGDLAVEIGFTRLAEMQEEILWLRGRRKEISCAESTRMTVLRGTQGQ